MITKTRKDLWEDPDLCSLRMRVSMHNQTYFTTRPFWHHDAPDLHICCQSELIGSYRGVHLQTLLQLCAVLTSRRDFGTQDTSEVYPDAATISMFRTAFAPLTEDLTRKLNRLPRYSALVYPRTFQHFSPARRLDSVISSARWRLLRNIQTRGQNKSRL